MENGAAEYKERLPDCLAGSGQLCAKSAVIGRHHFGATALRLGGLEVELDLDAVRVEQEQLIKPLIVDLALLERDVELLEVRDHGIETGGAEGDVVNDASAF